MTILVGKPPIIVVKKSHNRRPRLVATHDGNHEAIHTSAGNNPRVSGTWQLDFWQGGGAF